MQPKDQGSRFSTCQQVRKISAQYLDANNYYHIGSLVPIAIAITPSRLGPKRQDLEGVDRR